MTDKNVRRLTYTTLILLSIVMVFPFLWSLISSFKTPAEIITIPPQVFAKEYTLNNYLEVFKQGNFLRWYLNSIACALFVTITVCFFGSLAGYSFAKFDFPAKNVIFAFIVSTMMIPMQMLVIPWYYMADALNLVDTYTGIIFPGVISAFGIFYMKQAMETIPKSLIEAARIDGTSEFKIFIKIILPLVKPSLSALAILTFIGNWDAFLWPLIVINSGEMKTLPVGLQAFAGAQGINYHLIMASANLVILPVLGVYIILQKQIVKSIAASGVKG
jgi:multiple sugar transport system permease protein